MDGLDLKSMRLDVYQATPTQRKEKPPRHKQGEKFLKGPVPLKWLERAACLPGKALHLVV